MILFNLLSSPFHSWDREVFQVECEIGLSATSAY